MAALDEHHQAWRLRFKEHEWGRRYRMAHGTPLRRESFMRHPTSHQSRPRQEIQWKSNLSSKQMHFLYKSFLRSFFRWSLLARKLRNVMEKSRRNDLTFNWEWLENKSFAARLCWCDCMTRRSLERSFLFGFFFGFPKFSAQIFATMGEIEK